MMRVQRTLCLRLCFVLKPDVGFLRLVCIFLILNVDIILLSILTPSLLHYI